MVTVRIPTPLRTLTGGEDQVQVPGATLREVIETLEKKHPGITRSPARRQGRAALRQHLRRRRGRPLPRRPRDQALERRPRSASSRPSPAAEHARTLERFSKPRCTTARSLHAPAPSPRDRRRRASATRGRRDDHRRRSGRRARARLPSPRRRRFGDDRRSLRAPSVSRTRAFSATPAARRFAAASWRALGTIIEVSGAAEAATERVVIRTVRSRRLDSILDAIGNTPLLKLDRIAPQAPDVEIYLKLEFANPGGSVKDRPALRMIEDALADGRLTPDKILIDSTSGNTGVAYSLIGAALGIRVQLVMPKNVTKARKDITQAFGTELIFSDPMEGSDGAIRLVERSSTKDPDKYFYPDQYSNPSNPLAHYHGTGAEILDALGDRITHFVTGLGTSGTMMGTTRRLHEHTRPVYCVAVEPAEALHGLEGLKHMGSSIVPPIYDADRARRDLADRHRRRLGHGGPARRARRPARRAFDRRERRRRRRRSPSACKKSTAAAASSPSPAIAAIAISRRSSGSGATSGEPMTRSGLDPRQPEDPEERARSRRERGTRSLRSRRGSVRLPRRSRRRPPVRRLAPSSSRISPTSTTRSIPRGTRAPGASTSRSTR